MAVCALMAVCACAVERNADPVSLGVRRVQARRTGPGPGAHGKGHAPVLIDGHIDGATALIAVTYAAAADDASIDLSATGGLRVLSNPKPLRGATLEAGQTVDLVVELDPMTHRGNLVVSVQALYGGRRQAAVRSFSVGGTARSARAADAEQTVRIGGRLLRLMPAELY